MAPRQAKNIFEKVDQVLSEYGFDFYMLVCLSTDSAANMVGSHNGVASELQKN